MNGIAKKNVPNKAKAVKEEYKAICMRANDIGEKNMLLSSYALAAYFIALCRKGNKSPDETIAFVEDGLRKSRLLKAFMGNAGDYFSEAHMEKHRKWSAEAHQHKYKNDWVVDVLEQTPDYRFGLNYLECGVCKPCQDEGCPELAKCLCKLDFMLVEGIGIRLTRTQTLVKGCDHCDFRFHEKQGVRTNLAIYKENGVYQNLIHPILLFNIFKIFLWDVPIKKAVLFILKQKQKNSLTEIRGFIWWSVLDSNQ